MSASGSTVRARIRRAAGLDGCSPPSHLPAQSNENIAPAVIMSLAKELRKLSCEPLDGIKVVLNEDDVTDVTAEITGPGAPRTSALAASTQADHRTRALHCVGARAALAAYLLTLALVRARCAEQTPFEGGVFKVKLVLPSDYPQAPPKGARRTRFTHAEWRRSPLP